MAFLQEDLDPCGKREQVVLRLVFLLMAIIVVGFLSYLKQHEVGLIATNMNDQVSWGLYIANFTYLVGLQRLRFFWSSVLCLPFQADQRDRRSRGTLRRILHRDGHPLCDGGSG